MTLLKWLRSRDWTWFPLRWFVCAYCHGEGGERDVILDDGSGPWEECGVCSGTGRVGLRMRILQWWWDRRKP